MDAKTFQRRRVYRAALERDMLPGRAVRAWTLAKADEESRRRGWSYQWRDDPEEEGVDEVSLWTDAGEFLGSIGGVPRVDWDVRLAAAGLAAEVLAR